ncbi:MAG TPA: HAD family acid phosphatase [bacterium]|nr:HAD family acid phosphatase [bacterium]
MTRSLFLLCLAALFFSVACESAPVRRHTHERLHSTLYLQRSAEYQATCLQTYRTATDRLEAALKDPAWTAETAQTGDIAALPPAVILDIDETVLDNAPYYGQVVRKDEDFDLKQWNRWVVRAEAELIAGAGEFIAAAQKAGVAVYLVTNRDARFEAFTRLNLQRRGISLDPQTDTLLMLRERPEWKADKRTRRAFIAQTHRILMLVGDNLNDFTSIEGLDEAARKQVVTAAAAQWSSRWFAIPNPGYGNWIDDITGDARTDEDILNRKYAAIRASTEISDEQMRELMNAAPSGYPVQVIVDTLTIPTRTDVAPAAQSEEAPAVPQQKESAPPETPPIAPTAN